MNRSDLVRGIAQNSRLTQTEAREAIDTLVDMIRVAASLGEDVTIAGFGKFTVRSRPPAERVNPGTGEKIVVPARKTVTFKACKQFRDAI